jgi:aminoglycoside phosphotransferase
VEYQILLAEAESIQAEVLALREEAKVIPGLQFRVKELSTTEEELTSLLAVTQKALSKAELKALHLEKQLASAIEVRYDTLSEGHVDASHRSVERANAQAADLYEKLLEAVKDNADMRRELEREKQKNSENFLH